MAHLNGTPGWTLPKPELTPEQVTERSRQIAEDHQGLFMAIHRAAANLALAGDALGLLCFATACKSLLAGATALCADRVNADEIVD